MSTVITDVTVVDPRTGVSMPGQDVLIDGERIVDVRPTGPTPPGARVVDGTGKFLVPGFNDMHAHPLVMRDPDRDLELMLAFGVTGFRQMSGSTRLLEERPAGPLDAPRLLATAGPILSPMNAGSTEAVVATVRQQKELGADFVKAGVMSAEVFYAAQAEGNRIGIPIAGHLPGAVDVARASGDGMRSIEHLGPGVELLACCASPHLHIDPASAFTPKLPSARIPFVESVLEIVLRRVVLNPILMSKQPAIDDLAKATARFDEDEAGRLGQRLAADDTWAVPTLIRSKAIYLCDDDDLSADPAVRLVAPGTLRSWQKANKRFGKVPPANRDTFRSVFATMLRLTKVFDDAGVKMLAGSDSSGAAWVVPGAALHRELDQLALAGLTPLRVLQMTTSDAADFVGMTADLGSVTAGRYADLVLLDADPLASVDNLHGIAGVVRAGRYYDRGRLDDLREGAAR